MGGLAIQIPKNLPESKKFLPDNAQQTWFITSEGVDWCLNNLNDGRVELPDLSEEDIRTRSKANGLAKALVCTQALWFIAQCLTRRK